MGKPDKKVEVSDGSIPQGQMSASLPTCPRAHSLPFQWTACDIFYISFVPEGGNLKGVDPIQLL